jgi:hypothetical protein
MREFVACRLTHASSLDVCEGYVPHGGGTSGGDMRVSAEEIGASLPKGLHPPDCGRFLFVLRPLPGGDGHSRNRSASVLAERLRSAGRFRRFYVNMLRHVGGGERGARIPSVCAAAVGLGQGRTISISAHAVAVAAAASAALPILPPKADHILHDALHPGPNAPSSSIVELATVGKPLGKAQPPSASSMTLGAVSTIAKLQLLEPSARLIAALIHSTRIHDDAGIDNQSTTGDAVLALGTSNLNEAPGVEVSCKLASLQQAMMGWFASAQTHDTAKQDHIMQTTAQEGTCPTKSHSVVLLGAGAIAHGESSNNNTNSEPRSVVALDLTLAVHGQELESVCSERDHVLSLVNRDTCERLVLESEVPTGHDGNASAARQNSDAARHSAIFEIVSALLGRKDQRSSKVWILVSAVTLNPCEVHEPLQSATVRSRGRQQTLQYRSRWPRSCQRLIVELVRRSFPPRESANEQLAHTHRWWRAARNHYTPNLRCK